MASFTALCVLDYISFIALWATCRALKRLSSQSLFLARRVISRKVPRVPLGAPGVLKALAYPSGTGLGLSLPMGAPGPVRNWPGLMGAHALAYRQKLAWAYGGSRPCVPSGTGLDCDLSYGALRTVRNWPGLKPSYGALRTVRNWPVAYGAWGTVRNWPGLRSLLELGGLRS